MISQSNTTETSSITTKTAKTKYHDKRSFNYNNQKYKNVNNSSIRPSASHSNSLNLIAQFKKQHYQQSNLMQDPKVNNCNSNNDDNILVDISEDAIYHPKMSQSSSFSHSQSMARHSSLQVNQQQAHHQQHGSNNGFLLGTFLKVWTRLKRPILPGVGARSGGIARLKHSISNQSNGFEYIPGEQVPSIDTANIHDSPKFLSRSHLASIKLCDDDFRQSYHQQQNLMSIGTGDGSDMEKSNRVVCSGGSNTGSSGISSSSSQQFASQLHNNDNIDDNSNELTQRGQGQPASASSTSEGSTRTATSPSVQSRSPENHCSLVGEDKKIAAAATTSDIGGRRISAPPHLNDNASAGMNDNGFGMIRLHNDQNNHVNTNNKQDHRRQQRGLRNTLSEDVAEQMSDDLSGDDIYSTPNDSIISLQHQSNRRQSMVKSHSTNNFSLSSMNYANKTTNNQQPPPLPPRTSTNQITTANNSSKLNNKMASNSRFFISSSSSEDSSAISSNDHTIGQQEPSRFDHRQKQQQQHHQHHHHQISSRQATSQRLPFRLGVHYHSISPPSSLIRTSPQCLIMTSQQQTQQSNIINISHQPNKDTLFLPIHEQQKHALIINQTAPMSPMDISSPTRKLSSFLHGRKHQLMTSFHKKSPSLYDFQSTKNDNDIYNDVRHSYQYERNILSSQAQKQLKTEKVDHDRVSLARRNNNIPNSISLYNCQLPEVTSEDARSNESQNNGATSVDERNAEFKLAQMLLNMGQDLNVKDDDGQTALMYATLSDNFASIKCLVENGANINEKNNSGLNVLDLLCSKEPSDPRLNMLDFLISNGADCDVVNKTDGTRLLDRLIRLHQPSSISANKSGNKHHKITLGNNKLAYIEFLLQNGAKLGSSTWHAAYGKHEILLRLLRKLCQDGYYLYKSSSIEAAVYRFEYALKRAAELDYQLMIGLGSNHPEGMISNQIHQACKQLQYQTYLGLSRCELKRKFFDRALEFAQLAILIDSTAYEAYYSKGHILKNMGDLDGALSTINQSLRLVEKSITQAKTNLARLYEEQEEVMVIFEANYNNFVRLKEDTSTFAESRSELESMIDYLGEARRFISRLKDEIVKEEQVNCELESLSKETV